MAFYKLRYARLLVVFAVCAAVICSVNLAHAPGSVDGDCPSHPAHASANQVSPELVKSLIGWVAVNTMYDVSMSYRSPPEITFCDVGETIDYEDGVLIVDPILGAAFDLSRRTIHLVRPWSADDQYDASVLLHELIHDIQLTNRDWDCIGQPELEAYWLQDKWLAEQGVRSGFDWPLIKRMSTCLAQ